MLQNHRVKRDGFTLIELLVVIGIISILVGLLASAVQNARAAASRMSCLNKAKQLALALHQYHDNHTGFPPGYRSVSNPDKMPHSGWTLSILPYLEQTAIFQSSRTDYTAQQSPFIPPHSGLSAAVPAFACPSDQRVPGPQTSMKTKELAALTSYLGVSGRNYASADGILFRDSRVRLNDVTDGTSNTLIVGERPPSADLQYGWSYAGVGQLFTGSADLILGVRDENLLPISAGSPCGPGAYPFRPSRFNDPCGMFHFWSPHSGGAHFAFADGSVRFLTYSADTLLPALASREGGEVAQLSD